ncbi:hypothetical protein QL285_091842 [Trifolium repens]|nr:hypothetical protein QL285_091842 [Trifolium repens]
MGNSSQTLPFNGYMPMINENFPSGRGPEFPGFGVLQTRFKIIRELARLWDIDDLSIIMRSCIILYNMIVEDERDSYSQCWTDFEQSEENGSSAPQPYSTEVLPAFANHVRARSEFRDPKGHQELQADLLKHI